MLSISTPDRYPTWDEVSEAWYKLIPEADQREATLILPRAEDYINLHPFCFLVHESLLMGSAERETVGGVVKGCARCGGDHEAVAFVRFAGTPITAVGVVYDWWGVCPTTGDPIFMHRIEADHG